MEIEFKEDKIIFNRELSLLDSFVLSFTEYLASNNIKYVIVSGYVAIFFGRSRISEDVDILIENISFQKFLKFWSEIEQSYECLNTGNSYEAYNDYLKNYQAIRIAEKEILFRTLSSNL